MAEVRIRKYKGLCFLVFGNHMKMLAGCGKTQKCRHSRESGRPETIENTGFLLPQE
jgi:hypothetical protein